MSNEFCVCDVATWRVCTLNAQCYVRLLFIHNIQLYVNDLKFTVTYKPNGFVPLDLLKMIPFLISKASSDV